MKTMEKFLINSKDTWKIFQKLELWKKMEISKISDFRKKKGKLLYFKNFIFHLKLHNNLIELK